MAPKYSGKKRGAYGLHPSMGSIKGTIQLKQKVLIIVFMRNQPKQQHNESYQHRFRIINITSYVVQPESHRD